VEDPFRPLLFLLVLNPILEVQFSTLLEGIFQVSRFLPNLAHLLETGHSIGLLDQCVEVLLCVVVLFLLLQERVN
jgi:hypothetical protein